MIYLYNNMQHNSEPGTISPLTFDLGHEAEALLEVGADAVQTPAELGVAAVLVGAASVVAQVQLVAALGHGWDAVHLIKPSKYAC